MVDKDFSFDKIESILNGTSNFYISSNEELNKCLDHVVQLYVWLKEVIRCTFGYELEGGIAGVSLKKSKRNFWPKIDQVS